LSTNSGARADIGGLPRRANNGIRIVADAGLKTLAQANTIIVHLLKTNRMKDQSPKRCSFARS
jgi:hypothetical protein